MRASIAWALITSCCGLPGSGLHLHRTGRAEDRRLGRRAPGSRANGMAQCRLFRHPYGAASAKNDMPGHNAIARIIRRPRPPERVASLHACAGRDHDYWSPPPGRIGQAICVRTIVDHHAGIEDQHGIRRRIRSRAHGPVA